MLRRNISFLLYSTPAYWTKFRRNIWLGSNVSFHYNLCFSNVYNSWCPCRNINVQACTIQQQQPPPNTGLAIFYKGTDVSICCSLPPFGIKEKKFSKNFFLRRPGYDDDDEHFDEKSFQEPPCDFQSGG